MMKDLYSPAEIHRGEGNLNVANVEVLPVANANTQLETGNIGTGNTITMATLENSLRSSATLRLCVENRDNRFDFAAILSNLG